MELRISLLFSLYRSSRILARVLVDQQLKHFLTLEKVPLLSAAEYDSLLFLWNQQLPIRKLVNLLKDLKMQNEDRKIV